MQIYDAEPEYSLSARELPEYLAAGSAALPRRGSRVGGISAEDGWAGNAQQRQGSSRRWSPGSEPASEDNQVGQDNPSRQKQEGGRKICKRTSMKYLKRCEVDSINKPSSVVDDDVVEMSFIAGTAKKSSLREQGDRFTRLLRRSASESSHVNIEREPKGAERTGLNDIRANITEPSQPTLVKSASVLDDAGSCSTMLDLDCSSITSPGNFKSVRTKWFATKDNEVTRMLRAILEVHESNLDPRFVEESDFHESRRHHESPLDKNYPKTPNATTNTDLLGPLADFKVDFWSSTKFHSQTPRAMVICDTYTKNAKTHFFKDEIVILRDPHTVNLRGRQHASECTGRIIASPADDDPAIIRRGAENRRKPTDTNATAPIRRNAGSSGYYTVQIVAMGIVAGLLDVEPHQVEQLVSEFEERRLQQQQQHSQGDRGENKTRKKGRKRVCNHACPLQPRFEIVSIDQLESPAENKKRKLTTVLRKWILRYLSHRIERWKGFVFEHRQQELQAKSVMRIQGFWRSVLALRMTIEKRIAAQLVTDTRRHAEELVREVEHKKQRRREYQEWLKTNGITKDGVRFFKDEAELEAWYAQQQTMCARIETAVEQLFSGLKHDALHKWQYYIKHVLPPTHLDVAGIDADLKAEGKQGLHTFLLQELQSFHAANIRVQDEIEKMHEGKKAPLVTDELGDLPLKLLAVANLERDRRNAAQSDKDQTRPWHPALGIRLPSMSTTGVRLRPSGALEVTDIKRYEHFKEAQSGPTDHSCWLINGAYTKISFGAYPSGQARLKSTKITSRSSAVASLLTAGVDTFVCLLTTEELLRIQKTHEKGWPLKREADMLSFEIRQELLAGVTATKVASDFAEKRVIRGHEVGFGRTQQDALERAMANRMQDHQRAKRLYDNFSAHVQHDHFAMPKDGANRRDDEALLAFCQRLENRLRKKERLYIYSLGGCGRAGVVAALLLGRLYGLDPEQALERVQRCSDAKGRFRGLTQTQVFSCPRLKVQRDQVAHLLQATEPCYDSNVHISMLTDTLVDDILALRTHTLKETQFPRGQPPPL